MNTVKRIFVESKITSIFIKAEGTTLNEIILVKDDNDLKNKLRREASSIDEFPLKKLLRLFERYLNGEKVDFVCECDFSDYTDLEQKILQEVANIPYGKTASYEEIAEKVGNKNLRRAVGRTVGKNRFPIVVPCHRVIGKGGKMVGFSADGGIALKEKLLNLEKDTRNNHIHAKP